jgi:hypothetical protein
MKNTLTISPEKPTRHAPTQALPQTSPDLFQTSLDRFVLGQLDDRQQAMAEEHVTALRERLLCKDKDAVRAWAASRIAAEDVIGQIFAALRQNLFTENELSRPLMSAAKEFDQLMTSSHKRLMDWVEVLRRTEPKHSATVNIKAAQQVAIVTGKEPA